MDRRDAIAMLGGSALFLTSGRDLLAGPPPSFWKTRLADVSDALKRVRRGRARTLVRSAGGRDVSIVSYGERDGRTPAANYNSACGGGDPASYARKDGTQPPVVFLLGPVHGAEFEGVVGAGQSDRGRRVGQGLARQAVGGTGREHRPVPGAHRPVGEPGRPGSLPVRQLGGCGPRDQRARRDGDQAGRVELPMAGRQAGPPDARGGGGDPGRVLQRRRRQPHARRLVRPDGARDPGLPQAGAGGGAGLPRVAPLAREPPLDRAHGVRAPDGEGDDPAIGDRVQRRYADAGLPHRAGGPAAAEDGTDFPPPSFNLASALHHACGGVAFVHESPVGVRDAPYPAWTHEQILDLQLLFFDELFRHAVAHPVKWTR